MMRFQFRSQSTKLARRNHGPRLWAKGPQRQWPVIEQGYQEVIQPR